ncbi:MAG TPA: ATP-binding cassette domain-containing protein [Bacteroidales bacterium]|nr:ATP-binding cassette domain-containing protein [Bacteroidales bacterium]
MLELKNIISSYHRGFPILHDINLSVGKNERLALLGRNGAGKTTFANTIFGMVPHVEGDILIRAQSVRSMSMPDLRNLGLGYFMQGGPVFPQMTVKDNLLVASGDLGKKQFLNRFNELQIQFPLLRDRGFDQALAGSLSGGERTQLSLAMVLITMPGLLILDEPFAGLSPSNANLILKILDEYQQDTNATVILIAQDRLTAARFCTRHCVIRQGKILEDTPVL